MGLITFWRLLFWTTLYIGLLRTYSQPELDRLQKMFCRAGQSKFEQSGKIHGESKKWCSKVQVDRRSHETGTRALQVLWNQDNVVYRLPEVVFR